MIVLASLLCAKAKCGRLLLDVFGKIAIEANLIDRLKLRLKPIDVLLRIHDHIFKLMASREISDLGTMRDRLAKRFHIITLKPEICLEEIGNGPPHAHLLKLPNFRNPIQVQNVADEARRMADLLIREMAEMLMQPLVSPILAHGGMQQVLMNSRQF